MGAAVVDGPSEGTSGLADQSQPLERCSSGCEGHRMAGIELPAPAEHSDGAAMPAPPAAATHSDSPGEWEAAAAAAAAGGPDCLSAATRGQTLRPMVEAPRCWQEGLEERSTQAG